MAEPEYQTGTLILQTTNLEQSLRTFLSVHSIESDGEALIPLKNLENVIKNTEAQTVTLELIEDKVKIGALSLNALKLEEFPAEVGFTDQVQTIEDLSFEGFIRSLENLKDCISTDKLKSILLTGYYLNTIANEIVATDSYKLGTTSFIFGKDFTVKTSDNLIMPGCVYGLLKKVKSNTLKFEIKDNQLKLTMDNIELVTRLLIGVYPKYQDILDGLNNKHTIEFESEDFIKHLAKIQKILKPEVVKLTFESNSLKINCEVEEVGNYSSEIGAVGNIKEPMTMNFNPAFLEGVLTRFKGRVTLLLDSETKPVIIKQNEELKFLLMPIRTH